MANPLFPKHSQPSGNPLAAFSQFRAMVGGNPQAAFDSMYQTNPQFHQFADSMRGKTPEQAFRENGLDYGMFKGMF